MVTNTGYHGNNAVLSYVITALNAMLTDFNLASTWQVVRSNQPTIQAMQNNTIYVDIISKRRYGTQGTKAVVVNNSTVNASVWFEELIVQVSGFKQRDPATDTSSTLTSSDVVGYLQGCINANNDLGTTTNRTNRYGVPVKSYFTEPWMQLVKSTELKELDYETDSGLREKMPTFDFYLVVEQMLTQSELVVNELDVDTHPI